MATNPVVPFDDFFVSCYFNSHNDFMRKTGMNRSTFYRRINGNWSIQWLDVKGSNKLHFRLLQDSGDFAVEPITA